MDRIVSSLLAYFFGYLLGGHWLAIIIVGGGWTCWILLERAERAKAERKRREAERKRREEADAAALRQHKMAQEALQKELATTRADAASAYSRIPTKLLKAEELLHLAENEFADGAFSPFWEAIEGVLRKLAGVEREVESIQYMATSHLEAAKNYEGPIESFPVDMQAISRLAIVDRTHQRMRALIRLAQKDFQFSSIFEQRRTTNAVIAGFANLGQAIDHLGDRIVSSLDSLGQQVRDLDSNLSARHAEVLSSLSNISDTIEKSSRHSAVQQAALITDQNEVIKRLAEKQLALLDNIQRRRKPLDGERGPRMF